MSPPVREPRPSPVWRTFKAVGWGFFGVRRSTDHQEEAARLSPLAIIAAGFVAVLLFIGVLVALVKLAVA
ncbi:MAG: DUF2970 domain-containing protein [Xenophilus sp.]